MWLKVHSHGDVPVFGTKDISSWLPIKPFIFNKMTSVNIEISADVNNATDSISSMRYL